MFHVVISIIQQPLKFNYGPEEKYLASKQAASISYFLPYQISDTWNSLDVEIINVKNMNLKHVWAKADIQIGQQELN